MSGSFIGGWIALEMAAQVAVDDKYKGLSGGVVDIDGVVVDGEPIADLFAFDARGLAEVAWHDPERGYMDRASFTDQQRAMQQANGKAMAVIAWREMSDPSLLARLGTIDAPTLVVFGAKRPRRHPRLRSRCQRRDPGHEVRRGARG